ncbi:hypothetical protein [Actinospica robiniae]|uniref:hypothetical protein n=1 Tax=Actinospica robiniae TaxID=304901 RepID=UPI00042885BE|nr:hypothetical protein [Actinospica robiniae]
MTAAVDEAAVRARFEDLLERAGNPVLYLDRRIGIGFVDEGGVYSQGTDIVVARLWIESLPPGAIDALIARQIGAASAITGPGPVLALAAARLARYLRTLMWCGGLISFAFVPPRTAAAICVAAFLIGHVVCHLLRRIEYALDAYAVDLVGAEALAECLDLLRLPFNGTLEWALFVFGYGTHPRLDDRIRRVRKLIRQEP